jgi:hypothetical protein
MSFVELKNDKMIGMDSRRDDFSAARSQLIRLRDDVVSTLEYV